MDYRLKKHETFFAGCQRIAGEEIAAVLQELQACAITENPAEAVHDARRHLKKILALLRLLRPAIGEEAFLRERGRIRRATQRLATARDAEVSLRTLEQLQAGALPEALPALVKAREIFAEALTSHRAPSQRTLEAIAGSLVESGATVREWSFSGDQSKALAKGLGRLYRRARKAGRRASEMPSTERLHKWRQATKEVWAALRLLRSLADERSRKMAKSARDLGELLGDEHDLAILGEALRGEDVAAALGAVALDGIETLIATERARLQSDAWKLGQKLYEDGPRKIAKRARRF